MILHVINAKYKGDYQIELSFNDGKTGIADLKDVLHGKAFEPLKDKTHFSRFKLDSELNTICWNNNIDLAPEYLYYLSFKNQPDLAQQFREWGYVKD
jgi:hypothetical protein